MALKINIEKVEMLETNPEYLSAELFLNNTRTGNTMLDIIFHGVKTIPQSAQISIYLQTDKGSSGYSNIGVPIRKGVCEFIRQDKLFYPDFLKAGNFPKKCPINPGEYYVRNYVINSKEIPIVLPTGKFKLLINVDIDSKITLCRGYGIINITN